MSTCDQIEVEVCPVHDTVTDNVPGCDEPNTAQAESVDVAEVVEQLPLTEEQKDELQVLEEVPEDACDTGDVGGSFHQGTSEEQESLAAEVVPGEDLELSCKVVEQDEKLRARRVLKALNHPKDYHVDFKEFSSYCDRFPAAYSPIFNLQNSMRKKTMGIDWWFHKMQKYKEVRRKMGAEGGNIQQIVDTELQRFTDDALREKRMAERDAKIKQETSEVKKVIMQARQFLDEFS